MVLPILETKFYFPALRPELVPRPHLLARLDGAVRPGCRLALISAPAGFGKTTLAGEWVRRLGFPAAWLSLDEADNDPSRFWSCLVAALRRTRPDVGGAVLSTTPSWQPPSVEALLTDLINELTQSSGPLVLVLDDLHVIDEQRTHDGLTFLLENSPPEMHVIVVTRADPPWPLARMRVQGGLVELCAQDLRFRPDEVSAFVNGAMALGLAAETIEALDTRTEGWIAGLQMAALSMRSLDPERRASFVHGFGGGHRLVLDYLVEEVLSRQPDHIRESLLRTSILDRLTAPLCGPLMHGAGPIWQGSQAALTLIEQTSLFLLPLDDERRWYHYHHLLADLLHRRLRRARPEQVPALHLPLLSVRRIAQGTSGGRVDHRQ